MAERYFEARSDERGDAAEQVAFSSAVLGFRELWGERGRHAREAAPSVEPVPDRLAGAVQGQALVLHVAAAGDHGPLMIAPSISRTTSSSEGVPAQRPGSLRASP